MSEKAGDHIDVVSAVIPRYEGDFMVCQRADDDQFPGAWEFPGGKVEKGETHREALLRELNEELGIHQPYIRLVRKITDHRLRIHPNNYRVHFYETYVPPFATMRLNVHQDMRWLPLSILQTMMESPPMRNPQRSLVGITPGTAACVRKMVADQERS